MAALLLRFAVLLVPLCSHVLGAIDKVPPTGSCSNSTKVGQAVYCCSGACLDGTRIGDPGQCVGWNSCCLDTGATCGGNQVFELNSQQTPDSGDGCCGACCCECQWVKNQWAYGCCACPAGYQSVKPSSCDDEDASSACWGCKGSGKVEVLAVDAAAKHKKKKPKKYTPQCLFICNVAYNNTKGQTVPCNPKAKGSCPVNGVCQPLDTDDSDCVMEPACQMNAAGLAMLRHFEVGCPDYYTVPGTKGGNTIGFGHDCKFHNCKGITQPIGLGQMNELLAGDLQDAASYLSKWDGIDQLNSNQFSALVDYAFNAGTGNAHKYFYDLVMNGDGDGVCAELAKGKGERRQAEAALCNEGTDTPSGCPVNS